MAPLNVLAFFKIQKIDVEQLVPISRAEKENEDLGGVVRSTQYSRIDIRVNPQTTGRSK
jgi:hypothetical protein